MFRSKEDRFFVGAFDFDAMSLDTRIVFEGVVNDAAIESVERLKFNNITPAADFLGGFHGFLEEGVTLLGTIVADIESHLGAFGIFLKDYAVGDVLEFAESLALASDEAAGIIGLNVEEDLSFEVVLIDGRFKA